MSAGIRNSLIQWNDGPGFVRIYNQLNEAGFNIPITITNDYRVLHTSAQTLYGRDEDGDGVEESEYITHLDNIDDVRKGSLVFERNNNPFDDDYEKIVHVGIYLGMYSDEEYVEDEYVIECARNDDGFSGVQLTSWTDFKAKAESEVKIVLAGNFKRGIWFL